jgi:hypothetical protein
VVADFFRRIFASHVGAALALTSARRTAMKKVLGMCGLIALTVLPVHGVQTVTLKVTPERSFAPASVLIRARIEPSPANRGLAIVADGENFYRSSEIQLEGEQSPKTFELALKNLPGGEYGVYAVLLDASGQERGRAYQTALVIVPGEE